MTNLALKALESTHYKNLQSNSRIELDNLTILIGPNGFGKSNLIKALEFLKVAAKDSESIQGRSSFDDAIFNVMGGEDILDQARAKPDTVRLGFEFPAAGQNVCLELELLVAGQHTKPTISKEFLSQRQREDTTVPFYFYKFHTPRPGIGVLNVRQLENKATTVFAPIENIPVDQLGLAVIPRLLETTTISPPDALIYPVRRRIIESISTWLFYNANHMNLADIRQEEPARGPTDIFVSPSGRNLALVLNNLISDLDFEESLNQAMREILPWTRRIRPRPSGPLTIEWHFENSQENKEMFYLNSMSDGSVRMLCWAIILLSPKLPQLLVIEEPEIGIHPAWLKVLASWIKRAASRTQIIISTHHPDLLDHLTDQLEHILVMEESSSERHRFFGHRINRASLSDALSEGWLLGDLYRVGEPRIGGWPW